MVQNALSIISRCASSAKLSDESIDADLTSINSFAGSVLASQAAKLSEVTSQEGLS